MLHYLLSSRYPFMYSIKKPFVPEKKNKKKPHIQILIDHYFALLVQSFHLSRSNKINLKSPCQKIHSFAQKNRSSRKKREVFIIYIFVSYSVLMLKERGLSSEKYRKKKKKNKNKNKSNE